MYKKSRTDACGLRKETVPTSYYVDRAGQSGSQAPLASREDVFVSGTNTNTEEW